jgi:hypothetical protein
LAKYSLKDPVQEGDRLVTEIEVRALRVGDLRALEVKFHGEGAAVVGMSSLLDVAGSVLGYDPGFVDKLSIADGMAIGALIAKGFPGLS